MTDAPARDRRPPASLRPAPANLTPVKVQVILAVADLLTASSRGRETTDG